jgi:predicted MFS family arabinose efflux permease
VVAAQSLSWILGNPLIGVLTDTFSWHAAYAVPGAAALLALLAGLAAPRTNAGASADDARRGLITVVRDPSARRWTIAELVAYGAWTAELTYAGAFYIETYGVSESTVGLLLAVGSFAFMAVTLRTAQLAERFSRHRLIVTGALGMGGVVVVVMNVTPAVWFTVATFCVMASFAAIRTTSSSALALDQLPGQPGSMMAARTISSQAGYMAGALLGGAVLAVADFGVLGFVLCGGMGVAAWLFTRVRDPARVAVA